MRREPFFRCVIFLLWQFAAPSKLRHVFALAPPREQRRVDQDLSGKLPKPKFAGVSSWGTSKGDYHKLPHSVWGNVRCSHCTCPYRHNRYCEGLSK